MTEEQIERLRKWHKYNYGYITCNEFMVALIAINSMLNLKLEFGNRSEQTKENYQRKIYLNGKLISEVKE